MRKEVFKAMVGLQKLENILINTGDFVQMRDKVRIDSKNVRYPYIPLEVHQFANTIDTVRRDIVKRGKKITDFEFWDFGTGIGTKLVMANLLGFRSYGIEYNEFYIGSSRWFIGDNETGIKRGDLTNMEEVKQIVGFKKPIIAYYYCPFSNEDAEKKFELELENMLPKGSYLVPFLKKDERILEDKRFKLYERGPFHRGFYRKVKDTTEPISV